MKHTVLEHMAYISWFMVGFQVVPSYSGFRQSRNTDPERNESAEITRRSDFHASQQAACQGAELPTD
jgi:hypothetical protein